METDQPLEYDVQRRVHFRRSINDVADSRYDPAKMTDEERAALVSEVVTKDFQLAYETPCHVSPFGRHAKLTWQAEPRLNLRIAKSAIPVRGESRGYVMPPVVLESGFAAAKRRLPEREIKVGSRTMFVGRPGQYLAGQGFVTHNREFGIACLVADVAAWVKQFRAVAETIIAS